MHTPSPQSTTPVMTQVICTCDLGHRAQKALQQQGFRGLPPSTNPAAGPQPLAQMNLDGPKQTFSDISED